MTPGPEIARFEITRRTEMARVAAAFRQLALAVWGLLAYRPRFDHARSPVGDDLPATQERPNPRRRKRASNSRSLSGLGLFRARTATRRIPCGAPRNGRPFTAGPMVRIPFPPAGSQVRTGHPASGTTAARHGSIREPHAPPMLRQCPSLFGLAEPWRVRTGDRGQLKPPPQFGKFIRARKRLHRRRS
jgi:hypothetical protein